MTDRIAKLRASVEKDEVKILKLQESVKSRKEKIRELENAETMNNLNALSAKGMDVNEIVSAIRDHNLDVLMTLMENPSQNEEEKSGTCSAFLNNKEECTNE